MKYKKCYVVCGLMIAALSMTAVTGCGSADTQTVSMSEAETATGENTFAYEDDTQESPSDTTIMANVDSVDGNTVTLSVGGRGGQQGGTPPDGAGNASQDGSTSTDENGNASQDGSTSTDENGNTSQDGTTPPEMPSGDQDQSGTPPEKPADSADAGSENADATEDAAATDNSDTSSTDAESGDTDTSTSTEKSADGQTGKGAAPSGEKPTDMEAQSATLTIGDESVISVQGSDNDTAQGSLEDITEGTMLQITFDENGAITAITVSTGMGGGPGGSKDGSQSSGVESYDAATEYTEDASVDGDSFSSTGTDENAILVSSGASVDLNNITVERTSTDSTGGDNSSFYGVGAAVLTTDGTTYLSNADITTDAAGGAGVFAYDQGTVYVADSTIKTTQNTSGGIHVAGGGTLYAYDLDVTTDGESAAAIRSDRGGGTMVVDGGTYTSNGVGSPAVYCTADIAVKDADLTATGSEALCMEGLNSVHLYDCNLTGNMSDLETNDTTWTMIVYQSMSGDSEVGNSTMQLVGGSITSENGGLIYTTNTECNILMSDVDITYAQDSEFFLMCTGNTNERGWGTAGANGSDCVFTADTQQMQGNVVWDSISDLDFYMTNASTLTGAIVDDETYAGNGGDGYCNVYVSEDSTWTVTGDSTVTNLYSAGTIVDADGKTVSVVGTDGTSYVTGTSDYTITVESYSDSVDLSGAAQADSWDSYAVAQPDEVA